MLIFGFMFDPLFMAFMAPALLISIWASFRVKGTFNRFSRVGTASGLTGAQVARMILDRNGLHEVPVERTAGRLSDHYDPGRRTLRLSPDVHDHSSVAAVGVAAHEAGHALQHQQHYVPLFLRNTIAPVAAVTSNLSFFLIMIGVFINALGLMRIGVVLFSVGVVFTLITLPVEFNASSRARVILAEYGVVSHSEAEGVNKVLGAAAMTYVAAALAAVTQLLYFLLRSGLLGGDD